MINNKKNHGIIISDPMERYVDINSNYYKNYKRMNNKSNLSYSDLNTYEDKLYRFGDVLSLYGTGLNSVYLFSNKNIIYVWINYLTHDEPNIIRITNYNILCRLYSLSEEEKNILILKLEHIYNENNDIPIKVKDGLSKLLKR